MTKFERNFLLVYLISGLIICFVATFFSFKDGRTNGWLGILGTFLMNLSIVSFVELDKKQKKRE